MIRESVESCRHYFKTVFQSLQNKDYDNKFNTIQSVKLKTCLIRSNMHVYIFELPLSGFIC